MSTMNTASSVSARPEEHTSAAHTSSRHTTALDSAVLLQGQREILIRHLGHVYRLQATRQGKLILTK